MLSHGMRKSLLIRYSVSLHLQSVLQMRIEGFNLYCSFHLNANSVAGCHRSVPVVRIVKISKYGLTLQSQSSCIENVFQMVAVFGDAGAVQRGSRPE